MAELPELKGSALLELLNRGGARRVLEQPKPDLGYADSMPFPFLAMVGQTEMRFALLIAVINPSVGGVLLIGPRGVGKTTCVRSLTSILPEVPRPLEDVPLEEVDPDNPPPVQWDRVKLIELPLNARLEDVVGGVNERIAVQQQKIRLERGILARADQNVLYIDEINLLEDDITNAIIDAAAQGSYSVRRGAMVGTFRSRFIMVGSMNPEEGRLRPQIMDRFGLRVIVRGLTDVEERVEVYRRVRAHRQNPEAFLKEWAEATAVVREEIGLAQELLKETDISDDAMKVGIQLVQSLDIESSRAEFTLFEAARAHAAADGRDVAQVSDIRFVAPMALRLRRSEFMTNYLDNQHQEDEQIRETLTELP
ncbi:MAG: ATP-binding protein [Chloroflexi bacterium]|nr:ATP-binding protein [Chloroflexota bacterium]